MEDGEQCGRTGTFLLIKLLQFYFPVVQNLHLIGKHKVPQFYCFNSVHHHQPTLGHIVLILFFCQNPLRVALRSNCWRVAGRTQNPDSLLGSYSTFYECWLHLRIWNCGFLPESLNAQLDLHLQPYTQSRRPSALNWPLVPFCII